MTLNLNAAVKGSTTHNGSSQNALKAGIYSNRLLPHEDPQLLKECLEGYVRDFGITTSTGYQLAQELAQVVLKLNRIECWQSDLIEAHLAKYSTRYEFAKQLNLEVLTNLKLPDWYFDGCEDSRIKARRIYSALSELQDLIDNHSADLMMKIQSTYPDLWWFVMGTSDATAKVYTFAEKLSTYSTQTDPRIRLRDLKKYFLEMYRYELNWAGSEERYEKVLSGLRAQVQMELLSNPNLQRGEAALHRKKTDLLSQLFQIKREAQSMALIDMAGNGDGLPDAASSKAIVSTDMKSRSTNTSLKEDRKNGNQN